MSVLDAKFVQKYVRRNALVWMGKRVSGIPKEGFGIFQIPDAIECEKVVYDAIKTGYRLIDTATAYGNEKAVGKAVARAIDDGITTRDELFITTKVWVSDMGTDEEAYQAVKASLKRLDMDYAAQVDLRWNTQRGVSIIPKSVHVERMEQNIDIWDFTLTEEEMKVIASKDLGHSEIVNHDDPAFVKFVYNLH